MAASLLGGARALAAAVADIVAPARCAACEVVVSASVVFCPGCAAAVTLSTARSRVKAVGKVRGSTELAAFVYGGAIATAIVRMKYGARPDLASRLGALLAEIEWTAKRPVDRVVSVPLHPRRLVERGYDQAAILAWPVARRLDVPLTRALARERDTPRQAGLDRTARRLNVSHSFRCIEPRRIRDETVLLVDDVRTTGATLREGRRALMSAGARDVLTLVLAARDHPLLVD